jgi:hypothetical protein
MALVLVEETANHFVGLGSAMITVFLELQLHSRMAPSVDNSEVQREKDLHRHLIHHLQTGVVQRIIQSASSSHSEHI